MALAAVFLRAIVPAGWMPGTSADGTPVVLFTAAGLVEIVLGSDGKPIDPEEHEAASHLPVPCTFAATAHFTTPPAAFKPAPKSVYSEIDFSAALRDVSSGIAHSPTQARAPPAIS